MTEMRQHFLRLPPTADIPVIFFTQKEKHQSEHADTEHICNLARAANDHDTITGGSEYPEG